MTDERSETSASDLYRRGGQVSVRLASKYDPDLVVEAKAIAEKLLDHVRNKVEDFEDFQRRVWRGEEFSLHESAQVSKNEKDARLFFLRAQNLINAVAEAEARKARFGH